MTKPNVFVLTWKHADVHVTDVEVFDSMTLLNSFRLQRRILDHYSVHVRRLWTGREEDKVVAQPVESVQLSPGRHADGSRDYGWPT